MVLSLFHNFVKNAKCFTQYSVTNPTFYWLTICFYLLEKCKTLIYDGLPTYLGRRQYYHLFQGNKGYFGINIAEKGIALPLKETLKKIRG